MSVGITGVGASEGDGRGKLLHRARLRPPHLLSYSPGARARDRGSVAGEGEGPLATNNRRLGVVIASLDPVAADLVALLRTPLTASVHGGGIAAADAAATAAAWTLAKLLEPGDELCREDLRQQFGEAGGVE